MRQDEVIAQIESLQEMLLVMRAWIEAGAAVSTENLREDSAKLVAAIDQYEEERFV